MLMSLVLVFGSIYLSIRFSEQNLRRRNANGVYSSENVLLFMQGVNIAEDLQSLNSFIYGDDEDSILIANGILQYFFRESVGKEMNLLSTLGLFGQSPYAFLSRQGNDDEVQWLFAVQTKVDKDSVIQTFRKLHEGFSRQFLPASVRTRILPNDLTARDIVADSDGVSFRQHSYRHYTGHKSLHHKSGAQWIDAHRRDAYLLSNDEDLLKEAIDTGFMPAFSSFRVTRAGFDSLRDVFPDSDMIRAISSLIPEDGELCPNCLFCASALVLP